MSKKLEDKRIKYLDGLPDSQEKLRLLRLNEYVFKDSIKFLKNSLDALVKDMKVRNPYHQFKILAQSDLCLSNNKFDQEKFDMLKNGKSRLPYEKLTMKYLFKTTRVPDRSDYFSDLSKFFFHERKIFKIILKLFHFILGNTNIDDATYSDIKKFWSLFECRNIAEYSSYYVSKKKKSTFFKFTLTIFSNRFLLIHYYWRKYLWSSGNI